VIPKSAVKEYVNRGVDSHVWMKALTKEQLWAEVNSLKPRPRLYKDLGIHQLVCFLLGVAYPQFAFWLDMGTGKTLITLSLLQYWWDCGKLRRAVIFVTSDKAFPTWEKQIKRFGIDIPYITLSGSSEEKWNAMNEFGDGLILVPYPGAVWQVTEKVTKTRKRKKKNELALSDDLLVEFSRDVDVMVMDESTRASGHQSLTFELMEELAQTAGIRYALAGRPFGRDPTLLWAQHYLVDGGETLGTTLGMFREAFMKGVENRFVPKHRRKYIKKWSFDKRKKAQLARVIQHRSITYGAEECIDLPPVIPIIEEVRFSQEAEAYYEQAIETIVKSKGNMRAIENVFLRLRQLSSGFLGFKDDETGERAQIEFDENPKFDRTMELLDSMPFDRKGVVFYEYTHSGRKIYEEAKAMGLNPIWLWSGTENYARDMRNFEENDRYRLAVLNNKVGAFSLDGLQVANYAYFYESPVSPIDREQAERRLRRQGQLLKVFQYDIIVRGSADQKILDFHAEGESLMKALLRDPSILLKKK
jgi:hypothetical protein